MRLARLRILLMRKELISPAAILAVGVAEGPRAAAAEGERQSAGRHLLRLSRLRILLIRTELISMMRP